MSQHFDFYSLICYTVLTIKKKPTTNNNKKKKRKKEKVCNICMFVLNLRLPTDNYIAAGVLCYYSLSSIYYM